MLNIYGVTKNFGGLTAVSDIDLTVRAGEIVGLIGPNGAGKTTFFNVLTGLIKPNKGSVHFLAEQLTGLPPYKIAQRGIARTFQNIRLLSDESVLDNVKLGMFSRTKIDAWAAIFAREAVRREEERVTEESLAILKLVGLGGKEDR